MCRSESPVVFDERIAGTEHRERDHGDTRLDRDPERAVPKLGELARLRAGALREHHHRHPLGESVPAVDQRLGTGLFVAAHQFDVAGELHHPAHERDLEELALAHPLHLERQVRDQEDVDEALVVGDHHVGVSRVVGDLAGDGEFPEWVELLVHDGELPEQVSGVISTRIERCRHEPGDSDQRCEHDDQHGEREPCPDTQNGSSRLRLHQA